MASSNSELKEFYEEVIKNVVQSVHELFIEDGVEESILENLKKMWKAKLLKSGDFSSDGNLPDMPVEDAHTSGVPLQIILLSEPGINEKTEWQIQLPFTTLNQQLVQDVINNDTTKMITSLTIPADPSVVQEDVQHIASTSKGKINRINVKSSKSSKRRKIQQIDGMHDSSDTTSEAGENSDKAELEDEPPLNSDDDISEVDDFDTDNIIVCQYEKISRRFNKWKFYLKSGIMNLEGKDHVFKWFVGEAEW